MYVQTHSRGITVVLSFLTALPFDVLPEWAEIRALPVDAQKARYRDPDTSGLRIEVKEGDIILIPAGVAHTFTQIDQAVVYLDIKFPKAD